MNRNGNSRGRQRTRFCSLNNADVDSLLKPDRCRRLLGSLVRAGRRAKDVREGDHNAFRAARLSMGPAIRGSVMA